MTSSANVYALILAGGAGTRFWPASRMARPKQLLPLTGGDPLLLETARRILPLTAGASGAGSADASGADSADTSGAKEGWARILVASGRHLAEPTAALLAELPAENLMIEPTPRNTAPCIGWAASRVARLDPEAVMMVLPSDHHIGDVARFRETIGRAIASAASGTITTIGIRPTHPETGYGYIEVGEGAAALDDAAPVVRFVEKPDRARAEQFLASGRFLWNAGMFFFRAGDMMAAIREHMPALAEGLAAIDEAASRSAADELAAIETIFPTLPSISIDYGVIERVGRLAVVPGDFGWNDIGSWQSAWDLAAKDAEENAAPEGAVLIDARRNHVVDLRGRLEDAKRVIALVGVEDLVVVETDDALLVAPRSRAQDVKLIVDQLKQRGDKGLT